MIPGVGLHFPIAPFHLFSIVLVVNSPILTFAETSGTARRTILFRFSPTYLRSRISNSYSRRLDDALMSDMLLQGSPQSVPVNSLRWTDCFLALSHWSSWDMKHFRGASFQAWSAPPTLVAVQTYALLQRGRNALLIHFIGGTTFRNSL